MDTSGSPSNNSITILDESSLTGNPANEGVNAQTDLAQWKQATEVLQDLLVKKNGIVSSKSLTPELEKLGIPGKEMNTKLKLFNFDDPEPGLSPPEFRYYHRGRSFFSQEEYERAEKETEAKAKAAEKQIPVEPTFDEEEEQKPAEKRKNKQEEARLGKYVVEALEDIYASDEFGPEEVPIAFDIHNERPGSELENVDAIAIHWRSDQVVELVSVEIKLQFCAKLILQATNYKRFAHRVWIAVAVSNEDAAKELRENNPLLFEYVIDYGIGILACRRRQGGAYEVRPIHWPSLTRPDSMAIDEFVERYRRCFEQANVIEQRQQAWRPRIR